MSAPGAPIASTPLVERNLMSKGWVSWMAQLWQAVVDLETLRYSGSGSPETVIAAPVGSIYQRTDGGAGTSFYVKESGTGNTGWVGK